MAKSVIFWGLGVDFQRFWPYYEREILKNNICAVGRIGTICMGGILSKVKNIPIIERKDIMKYKFDYIIISSIIHSGDI